MAVEVLTREDLQQFHLQLLQDLKSLLQPMQQEEKKWLRSSEVRTLLKIAPSTLQSLRIRGLLHPTKIGGTFYYDYTELKSLLTGNNKK